MQPRKLNVAISRFPYGGNGGISSEHPDIADWLVVNIPKIVTDERVGKHFLQRHSDTPITMTRNRAVQEARAVGADVLLMIDSDMGPDAHLASTPFKHPLTNPLAKPFWKSSFDFLYEHWERGPVAVCAPYCGPPPTECVYVFNWKSMEPDAAGLPDVRLGMYEREHAAVMHGIQPCAAQPTGLILFDLRLFDLLDQPWFDYEYQDEGPTCEHCGQCKPGPRSQKCSTEDVVLTRDVAMHAQLKLGYNPLFCNWDAWAVHHKSKAVGMPTVLSLDSIQKKYADAVRLDHHHQDRLMDFGDVVPAPGEHVYVFDEELVESNGHAG